VLAATDATAHARAVAGGMLGSVLVLRGRPRRARALLRTSAALARQLELAAMEIQNAWTLAMAAALEGADADAVEHGRAVLARWRRTEDRHYAVPPLRWAATFFAGRGAGDEARACAEALGSIAGAAGDAEAAAALAHALGECALLDRDPELAVRHFGPALDLLRRVDLPFERAETQLRAAAALAAVGRRAEAVDDLTAAYRTARRLRARPLAARVADELAALGEPIDRRLGRLAAGQLEHGGLSRRELEVLRLVALGRTNREVAQELFLAVRTIDMHVRSLLAKLDCRSRVEALRRAGELGLLDPASARRLHPREA
jgi:DNA-binding CsgD family transcriptional regulator